jgi:Fur family ferric uptake transcriptional regulator
LLSAAHSTLTAFLNEKRLRKTTERFHILDKILGMPIRFTVDDLNKAIADDTYRLSRATVYNTLSILTDSGIIRQCPHTGTSTRYERASGSTDRFLIVCSQCGRTKEVKDPELARQIHARRYSAFHPSSFTLSIYGICSRCMRKNRKEKK